MSGTETPPRVSPSRWTARAGVLAAFFLAPLFASGDGMDAALDVYARPQQLVSLPDGRRMNLYCQGAGRPTVLLEAGAGGSTLEWRRVHRDIARTTRACAYDRAGLGFSEAGPMPRTADAVVQDFVSLLQAAQLPPPYLLVAHSLGSYFTRLYTDRHLDDVVGMVLVDPSVEFQDRRFVETSPPFAELLRQDENTARKCLRLAQDGTLSAGSSLFEACTYGYRRDPAFSDALYRIQIDRRLSVAFRTTLFSETYEMEGADSILLSRERRSYGDLPLIVLTQSREKADAYPGLSAPQVDALNILWFKMHDELASLSSRGTNRRVEGSGHYIQLDRPESVREAVSEILKTLQHTESKNRK